MALKDGQLDPLSLWFYKKRMMKSFNAALKLACIVTQAAAKQIRQAMSVAMCTPIFAESPSDIIFERLT